MQNKYGSRIKPDCVIVSEKFGATLNLANGNTALGAVARIALARSLASDLSSIVFLNEV